MRKVRTWLLAGTLGLGLVGRAGADEDDKGQLNQSITIAEVPSAARATLQREAQGAELEQLRKQTREDGTVVYQANVIKNRKETELQVDASGKLLEQGKPDHARAQHHRSSK